MGGKFQRKVDRLVRSNKELLEECAELREALELSEALKDKYKAALKRAREERK